MNSRYTGTEMKHGCPLVQGCLLPDLEAVWKRAAAQASGKSIYCAQPRAWRLCDGF
jgi:hypothetical protein